MALAYDFSNVHNSTDILPHKLLLDIDTTGLRLAARCGTYTHAHQHLMQNNGQNADPGVAPRKVGFLSWQHYRCQVKHMCKHNHPA